MQYDPAVWRFKISISHRKEVAQAVRSIGLLYRTNDTSQGDSNRLQNNTSPCLIQVTRSRVFTSGPILKDRLHCIITVAYLLEFLQLILANRINQERGNRTQILSCQPPLVFKPVPDSMIIKVMRLDNQISVHPQRPNAARRGSKGESCREFVSIQEMSFDPPNRI